MLVCSGRRLRYESSSTSSISMPARRRMSFREARSASEAYISSNKILGSDEQTAIAILECLEQQTGRESSLADSGWTDKDDIRGFGDELQFCQFLDLTARDSGLVLEGERLQSPDLGEIGAFDACL